MYNYYYVYILTNRLNTVLYVGMTSELSQRVEEHKAKAVPSFTSRYNVSKLVYYEIFDSPDNALMREHQLKGGSREKKLKLVLGRNPHWKELIPET